MFCPKCGASLPDNAVFCPGCGNKIHEGDAGAVLPAPDLFTAVKKYADFNGRASRQEYWLFVLLRILVEIVISIIGISAAGLENVLSVLAGLFFLIPGLAVTARRLHDVGSNGWRMLCYLIPVVGPFAMFCWMLHDSQPGANIYGENPKGIAQSDPAWSFKSWIGWMVGGIVLVLLILITALVVLAANCAR